MKNKWILFFLIVLIMLAPSYSAQSSGFQIIVTTPIVSYIDALGVYEGSIYVKNHGENSETITLEAYNNNQCTASVTKTVNANQLEKIGVCFTAISLDNLRFAVKNSSGQEIETKYMPMNEEFAMIETSAKENFSPQSNLYFIFNRLLDSSSLANIVMTVNQKIYTDWQYIYEENTNGTSKITISGTDGILPYGSDIEVDFGEDLKDILGETIGSANYTFTTCDVTSEFSVYQEFSIIAQAGLGGCAMLATFTNNAPVSVYFSRTTQNKTREDDLPFTPSAYAKIIDPQGNLAAIYDFTYSKTGTTAKILNVNYSMEGIWQIVFICGRIGDGVSIGLNNAVSWGVRGENILGVTGTTPLESYIYVPQKANSIKVASTLGKSFQLLDSADNVVANSAASINTFAKTALEFTNLVSGSVYKLALASDFSGGLIVDRVPSLLCSTKEMALALQGGWRVTEGIVCQGTIQESARIEALRLLRSKNFNVSVNKPATMPTINYPVAESLMFGSYGLISPLGDQVNRQIMDENSPYLGRFMTTEQYDSGTMPESWETGNFNAWGSPAFGSVVTTPAELNYFYKNSALINCSAISILGSLQALSEDLIIREGNDASAYPTTHGNFYFSYIAKCYADIREYLDEQTIRVIDNALSALCDAQGNYRGMNVTNQWLFTVTAVEATYRAIGLERHHDFVKRQISAVCGEPFMARLGQSSAGFFIENSGCDGSYHNLNQQLLYTMYKAHIASGRADAEIVNMVKNAIQKNIEFDSLFWTTQPEYVGIVGPNNFTSRTTGTFACIDHINYPVAADEFPLAKRRYEIMNMPLGGVGGAGTFPYYINNDIWAMRLINASWSKYENNTKGYSSNGYKEWYASLKNVGNCNSEPLPCEYKEGIWDKSGIIAVKHKGLYMNVFYTFPENPGMPDISFMGGGLSLLWSAPTGVAVASRKHNNYDNITTADDIMSTCVYGKNSTGNIVYNGKGKASLLWVEPNKIFEITESIPLTSAVVTWRYELRDNDIKMSASVSGDTTLSDLWLNVPVLKSETNAVIATDNDSISYRYDNREIEISAENGEQTAVSASGNVTRFRVKLDYNKQASLVLSAQPYSPVEIESASINSGILNAALKNKSTQTQPADVVIAVYNENGSLKNISVQSVQIGAGSIYNVNKAINLGQGEIAKLFVWNKINTLSPLDMKIIN